MSAWETQELPVLRALAAHFAEPDAGPAEVSDLARATGLSEESVVEALGVLSGARPPYVLGQQMGAMPGLPRITGLTDRALRELEHAQVTERLSRDESSGQWRPDALPGAPGGPDRR